MTSTTKQMWPNGKGALLFREAQCSEFAIAPYYHSSMALANITTGVYGKPTYTGIYILLCKILPYVFGKINL